MSTKTNLHTKLAFRQCPQKMAIGLHFLISTPGGPAESNGRT